MATTREVFAFEGIARYPTDDCVTIRLYTNLLCPETFGKTAAQGFDDMDRGATTRLLAQYLLREFHFPTRNRFGHAGCIRPWQKEEDFQSERRYPFSFSVYS